jgi:glycosyltransferase involved in cell wall biosynthesis
MKRLRVAMVGLRGLAENLGGVEAALCELTPRLAKRNVELTCYVRAKYQRAAPPPGVTLRAVPTLYTPHGETISYAAAALADVLLRGCDLLHLHAMGSALAAPLVRLPGTCPILTTLHGLDYRRAKWSAPARGALKLGEALAVRSSRAVLCVADDLARSVRSRYPSADVRVVPNGCEAIDPPPEPPADLPAGGYLLYLGRLTPEKNAHLLIEAYRAAKVDAPLVIAGPAVHAHEYLARCKSLAGDDPRIRFPGPVTGGRKWQLLCHAAAFVLPSDLEGHPVALLEAAAQATPAIVSDIPVHRAIFADTPGGLFVRPGDAADLARAITNVLAEPGTARATARAAQPSILARYDWGHIADTVRAIYDEVTAR